MEDFSPEDVNSASKLAMGQDSAPGDPSLWIVVANWMAEGAVGAAGAALVSPLVAKLLGQKNLDDIDRSIRQAVQQIIGFIRSELRRQITENEIRKLQSDTRSILENLKNFASSPREVQRQRVHLLQEAEIDLGKIRNLAMEFDFLGAPAYANAVSLAIMNYRLFNELYTEKHYLSDAIAIIDRGIPWLTKQIKANEKTWRVKGRHRPVYEWLRVMNVPTPSGPMPRTDIFYRFDVDGKVAMSDMNKGKVQQAHQQAVAKLTAEYRAVIKGSHTPLQKIMDHWRAAQAHLQGRLAG